KTNEWLAYLLEEHEEEFVERLEGEIKGRGYAPPAGGVAAFTTALAADFAADVFAATGPALQALAGAVRAQDRVRAGEALAKFWQKAEQLLGGYLAEEEDLVAGARRLAYLRLSEFGKQARAALAG